MEESREKMQQDMAETLRSLRARSGLSQRELAERAGIERSRISKTEIAWVGTSLDMVFKIADALEIEPFKLFVERD